MGACGGSEPPTGPEPTVATVQVIPGADTLLAIGHTRQFSAVVKDASGATLTGRTITWSSSVPSVATVNPTSGLATAVGNGAATIQATADGINGTAQVFVAQLVATVTVTPGNANLFGIGLTQQFTAVAKDSGGTGVTIPRFIWISSDPAVATVDTLGMVTSKHSGQTTITAAAQGIPGNAVLNVSQDAAQLAFRVPPPASTVAGEVFARAVQVEIRDAGGAVVSDGQLPITLAASAGTLKGTTTVDAVNGVASFSGLWMEQTGTGLSLATSTSGLTGATSASFAITPAVATALEYLNPPANDTAGGPLNIIVRFKDRFGNTATQRSDTVSVRSLTGGLEDNRAAAVNGVATFPTAHINFAALHRVVATAAGVDSVLSGSFVIAPASAREVRANFPTPAYANAPFSFAFYAYAVDTFSNVVTNASHDVTLSLRSAPWMPATLSGTTTIATETQGVVYFSDGTVDRPADNRSAPYWFDITSPGLRPDSAPVRVALGTVLTLGSGARHTCVATEHFPARNLYCWGSNSGRQLGDPDISTTGDSVAVTVANSNEVGEWVVGGAAHTCFLPADAQLRCFGANDYGQVGNGASGAPVTTPAIVSPGSQWSRMAAGATHTCALRASDGQARCWGDNGSGQLGTGDSTDQSSPVAVNDGGRSYRWITAGREHTCAIATADSTAYCWGSGDDGQLGQGAFTDSPTPVQVAGGWKFYALVAGDYHTCAVVNDAPTNVHCWGRNDVGQLGDGNQGTNRHTPAEVANSVSGAVSVGVETTIYDIAAGASHVCVRTSGNLAADVICWGANGDGQIGPDGGSGSDTGVLVIDGSTVTVSRLVAGGNHACVYIPGGLDPGVYCWGRNAEGQLGIGATGAGVPAPVRVIQ